MSTSLLYHAFGIRGYRYRRTDYEGGNVFITIEQPRHKLRCPGCGGRKVQRRGGVEREWQLVPIGGKPVSVRMVVARVHCRACRVIRQVRVPFAAPQRSYTRAFARYVLELRRRMTIQDVARHLDVSWWLVKDIEKQYLEHKFARPKLGHVTQIAIDEIAVGRGHKYLTIVLDLASGAILHVGDGKGGEALEPFWRRLKASRALIEAVAIDMSPAYIEAVLKHLPEAALVFDRFHLVKLLNDKLSQLRRDLHRDATDRQQRRVLKGTRWLLLKHPENLDDDHRERERLQEALQLNAPLATAYYLKEDLRQIWEQKNRRTAERFLDDWCRRAWSSGIRLLHQFANTLSAHRQQILNWYDYPISTSPLEGTNNKIKTMKRQAYGYRDQHYFRLKLFALHTTRYELIG